MSCNVSNFRGSRNQMGTNEEGEPKSTTETTSPEETPTTEPTTEPTTTSDPPVETGAGAEGGMGEASGALETAEGAMGAAQELGEGAAGVELAGGGPLDIVTDAVSLAMGIGAVVSLGVGAVESAIAGGQANADLEQAARSGGIDGL